MTVATPTDAAHAELLGESLGFTLRSSHDFSGPVPRSFATREAAWRFAASDLMVRERDLATTLGDVKFILSDPERSRAITADGTSFEVRAAEQDNDDWSDGWARRKPDGTADAWGFYRTDDGATVCMFRGPRNHVRFYDATRTQRGVEQRNVAPGVAFAHASGWVSL